MTINPLNRRTLLAAGGAALVTGATGLFVPAEAKSVKPPPPMRFTTGAFGR